MGEWREVRLSTAVELIGGGTPKTTISEYWNGKIPWLSVVDFNTGQKYVERTEKTITEAGLINSSTKLIKTGDIIISARGTVGAMAVLKRPMAFNQSCYGVRCINNLSNQDFLFYLIKNSLSEFLQVAHGGVFDTITRETFDVIDIKLPPLPEQKAIAEVLSSLDDKIDLLHRQNKTLEQMAETLFRQWFVEEAEEDWVLHQLGDFVEVLRGLSYKGIGLAERCNGIPMHNLNSVLEGGGYKYSGIKYYSGDYKERHLVLPGDLIVTNTEQGHDMLLIGYPAIVPKYFGELGIFSQHLYKLKLKNNELTIVFLKYFIMTHDIREQIAGGTNGSTVNMLAKDVLEWVKFKLPSKLKINLFTKTVKPLLEKKETNHSQIRTLEKLRDTLLPKLMSGEVRVDI